MRSAGVDPEALTFAFRPLWQLDAASKATVALNKAQATQIYAGLKLWPADVTARLVEAQLAEDGTYPGAEGIFAAPGDATAGLVADFDPNQPRDPEGKWTTGTTGSASERDLPLSPKGTSAMSPSAEGATPQGAPGPRAPDGTPITPAALGKGHGRGLAHAAATLLGFAARLMQRWRSEQSDPGEPGSQPPTRATSRPPESISPEAAESSSAPPKLTSVEVAGLRELFKGGEQAGGVIGARRLLDRLAQGNVELPEGVTRQALESYAEIARRAIAAGIDKQGVQALRLQAIKRILER